MQIILSDDECFTLHEALLTEIHELKINQKLEDRKGRGHLEQIYIDKAEALRERIAPYATKK